MSEVIEKTFSVSFPIHLSVNNIRGSVEIHPGEDNVIQVIATKQSHTGDDKRTEIEITQEAEGCVKVATRFPTGSWNWLFGSQPCEVDYVVKAPRLCSFKLNSVSNRVLVEGFEGDFRVNSVNGDITLRDVAGSIQIHTVSAETKGERITGSLDLDTVSGDLTWRESTLASIKTKSVSGDMLISTSLGDGPYDFKSVSGNVRLIMPPATHSTAELHSVSGDLVSTFPITGIDHHHDSQTVNVQGSGVIISLHSVSGDLSLICDGEIQPSVEIFKTVTNKDRCKVLESVERGDLTVDEALMQLRS
jgi:hypothetical protein